MLSLLYSSGLMLVSACNNDISDYEKPAHNEQIATVTSQPLQEKPAPKIENKHYFFDMSAHSIDDFENLLIRTEMISRTRPDEFKELEIVMIIHGPDIDWFTYQNHDLNHNLISLAERLDAYGVIDMKVCQTTMKKREIKLNDLPDFIEPVPYGPDEINRLIDKDYIYL